MQEAEYNYTPKFKEAFERFKANAALAVKKAQDLMDEDDPKALEDIVSELFREEMRALGSEERIKNLYKIRDKDSQQFEQFCPNSHQMSVHTLGRQKIAILKSRQVGFTTYAVVRFLDKALFDYWPTGIMSHKKDHVNKIFGIVRDVYSYFKRDWGDYYRPVESFNNANELSWEDTKASMSVAMDFQGRTVKGLHVSEAHFISTERLVNSFQAVPDNGEIFLETTPNGRGGHFFGVWQDWETNGEDAAYYGIFVPWFEHYPEFPERYSPPEGTVWTAKEKELQEKYNLQEYHLWWRRRCLVEKCDRDEDYFDKHYPADAETCWLAGSFKVFKRDTLVKQQKFIQQPIAEGSIKKVDRKVQFFEEDGGLWKIYSYPKVNNTYSMGCDPSTGTGHDPAVICIINNETGEQVAKFSGFVDTDYLTDEIYKAGHLYNRAHVCPEINGPGLAVVMALKSKYFNIYKREEYDSQNKKTTSHFGFYTSSVTKDVVINYLTVALREGTVKVRDQETFDQLTTFIHKVEKKPDGRLVITSKKEAEVGCFDDEVIALALANEMRRARPGEDMMESRVVENRLEKDEAYADLDDFLL